MRDRNRSAVFLLSLAVAFVIAQGRARSQSPSSSATMSQLKQVAYLKASNAGVADHFGCGGGLQGHAGHAVAISRDGNTIVIGAHQEKSSARSINGNQNDDSIYNAGAVYVFARRGDAWVQQAYVKASNSGQSDNFGYLVALSADGNTMAASAQWEASAATGVNGNQNDDSIQQAGAVYVFIRTGDTWSQQAYIKASNTGRAAIGDNDFGDGDQFGYSIALSGDGNTLAVGAITEDSAAKSINGNQDDDSVASSGAVYTYTRSGTTWKQEFYVKGSNTEAFDEFGASVALSRDGKLLVVGAPKEDSAAKGLDGNQNDNAADEAGAVYVFAHN